jgi:hypothetical protein
MTILCICAKYALRHEKNKCLYVLLITRFDEFYRTDFKPLAETCLSASQRFYNKNIHQQSFVSIFSRLLKTRSTAQPTHAPVIKWLVSNEFWATQSKEVVNVCLEWRTMCKKNQKFWKFRPRFFVFFSLSLSILYLYILCFHTTYYSATHNTNIHVPGGIRNRNPSRRAATGLCPRPCGRRDHPESNWTPTECK